MIIRPDMPQSYFVIHAQASAPAPAVTPAAPRVRWYAARPSDASALVPMPRSQGAIDFFGLFLHRALAASQLEPRH